MFGVEVAIFGVTCLVAILLLLTSPLWMRGLTALASAIWRQLARTDEQMVIKNEPKDVIEGEYREVDK